MEVDANEAKLVSDMLWAGEVVEKVAKQRRLGPGGSLTAPTSVICTNKRLIIVDRAAMGLRKDFEVIQYKQITSVRFERGIVSSSVFIRIQGYDRSKGILAQGKDEGQIEGLSNKEASDLADYINKKISAEEHLISDVEPKNPADADGVGAYVYCGKCGHKDRAGMKYCENCGAKLP